MRILDTSIIKVESFKKTLFKKSFFSPLLNKILAIICLSKLKKGYTIDLIDSPFFVYPIKRFIRDFRNIYE